MFDVFRINMAIGGIAREAGIDARLISSVAIAPKLYASAMKENAWNARQTAVWTITGRLVNLARDGNLPSLRDEFPEEYTAYRRLYQRCVEMARADPRQYAECLRSTELGENPFDSLEERPARPGPLQLDPDDVRGQRLHEEALAG